MKKIPACREIIRLAALGCSDNKISEITGSTRRTVKKIREQAVLAKISWPLNETMDDEKIYYLMFPPKEYERKKKHPNLEQTYNNLSKKTSRIDLYDEYYQECMKQGETPVTYSWFCKLMKKEEFQHRITTDEKVKPGECLVIFWMEISAEIIEAKTEKAYVFMGILPYSQNVFVMGYKDRGVKTWIKANLEMFQYFDGVPEEMIVRGMKSGISRCMTDTRYMQMIEHYGIVRIKDNIKQFETEIGEVETWFMRKLDGEQFDNVACLNQALYKYRKEFLQESVRSEKTREQIFLKDEKPFLRELPEDTYYVRKRKPAQIQRNCHVVFEKKYYSVPYQFLLQGKTKVELEATSQKITIYYDDNVIAEHPNMQKEYTNTYSTHLEHMPSDEQELLLEWNKEIFLKRAGRVGKHTQRVVEAVIDSKFIRQQTYKACDAILRLGTVYTNAKLEAVCAKIPYVKNGSVYKTIADELAK